MSNRHVLPRPPHPPSLLPHLLPPTYTLSPTPTSLLAQSITFPSSIPSSSPTTLPITTATRLTSLPNDPSTLLTLQQLLYLLEEQDSSNADYMRKAAAAAAAGAGAGAGFRPIGILDRKVVLEYLRGGEAPRGRVVVEGTKAEDKVFEGAPTASITSTSALNSAIPAKRRYIPDEKDKEFCRKITKITLPPTSFILPTHTQSSTSSTSTSHLSPLRFHPPGKPTDFSSLRESIWEDRVKPLRDAVRKREKESAGGGGGGGAGVDKARASGSGAGSGAGVGAGAGGDVNRGQKKRGQTQQNIILLSSSPTALVSMWNVKRLLEDGTFEKTEDAKARQQAEGNRKMEDVVMIYRTIDEKKVKYYAIDNIDVLQKFSTAGSDPWDRVLCIFTTGQAWQFKPYKIQDPKLLFKQIPGVYFRLTTEQMHPAVRDWSVREFKIDAVQRHTDRPVVGAFWSSLDKGRR